MNLSITRRLFVLASGLAALLLLMGWAAYTTWVGMRELRQRFSTVQIESFRIADRFQAAILRLDSILLRFQAGVDPAEWKRFEAESRRLNDWIDAQKSALTTPAEKAVFVEIDAAYDDYVANARGIAARKAADGAASLIEQFGQVEEASQRLLAYGNKLASAHREALNRLLTASQRSLTVLQQVIVGALIGLALLSVWTVSVAWRELIAPLRTQLIESRQLLERQEKLASLGILAAGVAHEIRNPLTAIKARLYTQQRALPPNSPSFADAEFIGKEIDRLERIVRDFLRFARPPELACLPVSPAALLRDVRELLAPQLSAARIVLEVDQVSDRPVMGDPEQLKQVMINLVQNAAESISGTGTVTMRALRSRVVLEGHSRDATILEVEDNGRGIPPEVQKRLFDPFFSTKQSGTGLGLAIAARIIEKHGGALRFQSEVNSGTTFGVVLPDEP